MNSILYFPHVYLSNRTTKYIWQVGFAQSLIMLAVALVWFLSTPTLAHAGDPDFTEIWFDDATDTTQSMAWGDYDGDGDLDLAVGNNGAMNRLYRNVGEGNFQEVPGVFGAAADLTTSVAWGDVDGDGDLDLAIGNDGTVNRLYRNDGNKNFQERVDAFGPAADSTTSVAWGDMDDDGDLDLAVGNVGINRLFQNDGVGNFIEVGNHPLGMDASVTRSLAWGDMDGDGDLDLALGNAITSTSQLLRNDGHGSFSEVPEALTGTLRVWSLAWGDMDNDGDLDLVVGNENDSNQLLQNAGNGNFNLMNGRLGEYTTTTQSVAWGDMDSDGDLDLALGNRFNDTRLFRNEGDTVFYEVLNALTSETHDTRSVAWGDMDRDGDLDLATGNAMTSTNQIFRNEGSGSFSQRIGAIGTAHNYTKSMAWGDIDGDGDLDLAVGNDKKQANQLFRNDENGRFSEIAGSLTGLFNTWSLAWGDMDGDGDLDLAAGNFDEVNQLYENKGSGLLQEVNGALGLETDPTRSVAWGDMDGDGDLDLAVGNSITATNRLYRNQGNGIFSEVSSIPEMNAQDTYNLAWGDMNGDGDLDLAVGNNGANQLFDNDGAGNLTEIPGALGPDTRETWSLAWGDMDGDGDLDLAVGNSPGVNQLFRNDGDGRFSEMIGALGPDDSLSTESVAWGDMDGDGDLDLAVGNSYQASQIFRNDGNGSFQEVPQALKVDLCYPSNEPSVTGSLTWGDMDGDGDLDLAVGYSCRQGGQRNTVFENTQQTIETILYNLPTLSAGQPYTSTANFHAHEQILDSQIIPITYTLFDPEGNPVGDVEASYSFNGGGQWFPAVATTATVTTNLSTGRWYNHAVLTPTQTIPDTGVPLNAGLTVTETGKIADVEIWFAITHTNNADLAVALRSPEGMEVPLFGAGDVTGQGLAHTRFSNYAATSILSGTATYTRTYRPVGSLAGFEGQAINGTWTLVITDSAGGGSGALDAWGLRLKTPPVTHVFRWDTFASDFFGQSDNVVFRLVAYPQPSTAATAGTYKYTNTVPGPFQRPYASSTSFPFRVRGTQVQVLSGTTPISNAIVYRLPAGQSGEGRLIADNANTSFYTDGQGYLQGRGELGIGDRLLTLAPVSLPPDASERFSTTLSLYYTNIATVTETGLETLINNTDSLTVNQFGVQQLRVSPQRPLLLFDLDVSLEWDSSSDPTYLQQIEFDLKRASEHLFDFTDGQVALGNIWVYHNADNWSTSHINIHATNRLRPYATIGGVVLTDTLHVIPELSDISYGIGQIHMGSTWNRYGNPAQSIGVDWPLILAHELGHYLLFLEDTYLGLEEFKGSELLTTVDDCLGSAMGDVYNINNTELVFDDMVWNNACAETLANRELGRDEWEILRSWYPWLQTPASPNNGPGQMPYELTTVTIFDPVTPTNALQDPTFYLDYEANEVSTSEARAFLLRNTNNEVGIPATTDEYEYVYDLGNPVGGQNRLLARGAQIGDRLCVFDQGRTQFGCEIITLGDERLQLKKDETWQPVIKISPVTSVTFEIEVDGLPSGVENLMARFYPEYGQAFAITGPLNETNGLYRGSITLDYAALNGNLQLWIDEEPDSAPYINPRRETIVTYRIGGNPGQNRSGGGQNRSGGGQNRSGGGQNRSGGGQNRSGGANVAGEGGAPAVSPDGQMTYFDRNFDLAEGQFYTVQDMASLPKLPDGKVAIGRGYNLFATGFATATNPLTGSISFQYLSNDVLTEEKSENELGIHFWNGTQWQALDTRVDTTYNLASAISQGPGVYALLAGVTTPVITNVVPSRAIVISNTQLITITGGYFLTPTVVFLVGPTATYTLPVQSITPYTLTAVVSPALPAREYQVWVSNRNQAGGPTPSPASGTFALFDPAEACFYDFFESGAGKWQRSGDWDIAILPDHERAITDSPSGTYNNAITPTLTVTTAITSEPFNLADCANPTLTFRHDYVLAHVGSSQDVAQVELSTNDGQSWSELASYSGGGIFGVAIQDVGAPEWTTVDWKDVEIDLIAYTDTVRLRFSLEVDQAVADKGWLIDDVLVQSKPPFPITSNDVFLPIIVKED